MEAGDAFDFTFVVETSSCLLNQYPSSLSPFPEESPFWGYGGCNCEKKGCFLHFPCIKWSHMTHFWSLKHKLGVSGKPFAS